MKKFAALLILILWTGIWGCSTAKFGWEPEPQPDQPESPAESGFVEDFDPLSLEEEDIRVKPLAENKKPAGTEVIPAVPEDQPVDEAEMVQGYRVQLFLAKIEENAMNVRKRAVFKFNERVDLVFHAPNYRVLVGEFLELKEARKYAEKAKKLGFHDAWAVPARVNPNNVTKTE